MVHGALVLFGSGPGIGVRVAQRFSRNHFSRIVLLSRNSQRLSREADALSSDNPGLQVDTVAIDLADTESVLEALARVDLLLADSRLEVVVYNAARLNPSKFFEYELAELETDLRVSVGSLYTVAKWAFPKFEAVRSDMTLKPSFLVTSGGLHRSPVPAMFSLSACKAAQYNLIESLHKEYSPNGIHSALVVVGGSVSDESPHCSPAIIAEKFWELYIQTQPLDLSVELVDPDWV
jgi:short-subunit dehydrogenase